MKNPIKCSENDEQSKLATLFFRFFQRLKFLLLLKNFVFFFFRLLFQTRWDIENSSWSLFFNDQNKNYLWKISLSKDYFSHSDRWSGETFSMISSCQIHFFPIFFFRSFVFEQSTKLLLHSCCVCLKWKNSY